MQMFLNNQTALSSVGLIGSRWEIYGGMIRVRILVPRLELHTCRA